MGNKNKFTFDISLSVLNHLGRNLYRSFITVLGEAISNSWDADADNVWIYLDRNSNTLVIKDDGIGMDEKDFQEKFLKIGYSKRKDGVTKSTKDRPFIGRKGIGKLALLSCANKISIITKTIDNEYVGGVIDNTGLDKAINDDLTPQQYPIEDFDKNLFQKYIENHQKGTIIYFEDIKDGIRNTESYLKKLIALYFRFSLLDNSFNIHLNGDAITIDHLKDLADKTQFLWNINNISDPYILNKLINNSNLRYTRTLNSPMPIKGFIASVNEPKDLKVFTTDEKISIDLFVNGRLREKDIIKHIPSARIVESYLYGQIHYDDLDGNVDRFTSSREGVVANDPKFIELLENLKLLLNRILEDWDDWRIKLKKDGDSENKRITRKERKSRELYNVISEEYSPPEGSSNKGKIDGWVDELSNDAQFNFSSYGECFISENLIRKYIQENKVQITKEAQSEIDQWKTKENTNKNKGNISIELRKNNNDLTYLSMDGLANLVDKADSIKDASLSRDAKEYKPVRDALAHTALLTDLAKKKLSSTYENLKNRINILLNK